MGDVSDSFEYTRIKTRDSNTNFYYSFLFLPKKKRDAIFTIYSFCRETDDIVDSATDPDEARIRLEAWRREVDACFAHHPTHPITQALQQVIRDFPLPASYFHDLVNGCEMDLVRRRYETFSQLETYCYHVAGVVGLICIEIFGYRSPHTKEYAINLGKALQLTNILRDVGEDARRGRIYLPLEDLDAFGYSEADLLAETYNPACVELLRFETERARSFFSQAQQLYERRDHDLLFPAEIMHAIYRRLLDRIAASRYDVFHHRARIPNGQKLLIALHHWLKSRWSRTTPWVPAP